MPRCRRIEGERNNVVPNNTDARMLYDPPEQRAEKIEGKKQKWVANSG
jgi:hypothetical protein